MTDLKPAFDSVTVAGTPLVTLVDSGVTPTVAPLTRTVAPLGLDSTRSEVGGRLSFAATFAVLPRRMETERSTVP